MKFKKLILKIAAWMTLMAFSSQTLFAQSLPQPQSAFSSKEVRVFADQSLLPAGIGKVNEIWGNSSPSVFLVQDPHGQEEGQKNIQKLLEFIHGKTGFETLLIEGGIGQQDPALLDWFTEKKWNDKAAAFLLHEGHIGGPELFLKENRYVKAEGLEALDPYIRNLELFQSVMRERKATSSYLRDALLNLKTKASRSMTPALHAFFKMWLSYENGESSFPVFLEQLATSARETLEIDLKKPRFQLRWPMLVRYAELKRREPLLNAQEAVKDRAKLEAWALKNLGRKLETEFQDRRRFWELFYEEASPKGFDFKDYPALMLQEGFEILQAEMDAAVFFEEFAELRDETLHVLVKDEKAEGPLLKEAHSLLFLKKLFDLELTPEEFGTAEQGNAEQFLKTSPEEIRTHYQRSMDFYRTALERDTVMARAIVEHAKRSSKPVVAIAGGFHTPGLTQILKEQNLSYALLSPHLSEIQPQDAYQAAMLGETRPVDMAQFSNRVPSEITPLKNWQGKLPQSILTNRAQLRRAFESSASAHGAITAFRAEIREDNNPILMQYFLKEHLGRESALFALEKMAKTMDLSARHMDDARYASRLRQDWTLADFNQDLERFLLFYGRPGFPAQESNRLLLRLLEKLWKTDAFYNWQKRGDAASPLYGQTLQILSDLLTQDEAAPFAGFPEGELITRMPLSDPSFTAEFMRRDDRQFVRLTGEMDTARILGLPFSVAYDGSELRPAAVIPEEWYRGKNVFAAPGYGNFPFELAKHARQVTAVDIDPTSISWQTKKVLYGKNPAIAFYLEDFMPPYAGGAEFYNFLHVLSSMSLGERFRIPNLHFLQADLTKQLPFEDEIFDFSIAPHIFATSNGIESSEGVLAAINEMLRVTRIGGRIVILPTVDLSQSSGVAEGYSYYQLEESIADFSHWLRLQGRGFDLTFSAPFQLHDIARFSGPIMGSFAVLQRVRSEDRDGFEVLLADMTGFVKFYQEAEVVENPGLLKTQVKRYSERLQILKEQQDPEVQRLSSLVNILETILKVIALVYEAHEKTGQIYGGVESILAKAIADWTENFAVGSSPEDIQKANARLLFMKESFKALLARSEQGFTKADAMLSRTALSRSSLKIAEGWKSFSEIPDFDGFNGSLIAEQLSHLIFIFREAQDLTYLDQVHLILSAQSGFLDVLKAQLSPRAESREEFEVLLKDMQSFLSFYRGDEVIENPGLLVTQVTRYHARVEELLSKTPESAELKTLRSLIGAVSALTRVIFFIDNGHQLIGKILEPVETKLSANLEDWAQNFVVGSDPAEMQTADRALNQLKTDFRLLFERRRSPFVQSPVTFPRASARLNEAEQKLAAIPEFNGFNHGAITEQLDALISTFREIADLAYLDQVYTVLSDQQTLLDSIQIVLPRAEMRTSIEMNEAKINEWLRLARVSVKDFHKTPQGVHLGTQITQFMELIGAFPRPGTPAFKVFDAGSGQGFFAFRLALERPNVLVFGVEGDTNLYSDSLKVLAEGEQSGEIAEGQIQFAHGDFNDPQFAEKIREADIVYYYESGTSDEETFQNTLLKNMKPGSRLIVLSSMNGSGFIRPLLETGLFTEITDSVIPGSVWVHVLERSEGRDKSENLERKRFQQVITEDFPINLNSADLLGVDEVSLAESLRPLLDYMERSTPMSTLLNYNILSRAFWNNLLFGMMVEGLLFLLMLPPVAAVLTMSLGAFIHKEKIPGFIRNLHRYRALRAEQNKLYGFRPDSFKNEAENNKLRLSVIHRLWQNLFYSDTEVRQLSFNVLQSLKIAALESFMDYARPSLEELGINTDVRSENRTEEEQVLEKLKNSTGMVEWFQAMNGLEESTSRIDISVQIARGIQMKVPMLRSALTDPELKESAYRYLAAWAYNLSIIYGTSFVAIGAEGEPDLIDVSAVKALLTRPAVNGFWGRIGMRFLRVLHRILSFLRIKTLKRFFPEPGALSDIRESLQKGEDNPLGIHNYSNAGHPVAFKELSDLTDEEKQEKPVVMNAALRTDAKGVYAGIDIGGGSAKIIILKDGHVLELPDDLRTISTVHYGMSGKAVPETPQQYVSRMAEHMKKIQGYLKQTYGVEKIDGVGMDSPGAADFETNSMKTLGQIPVKKGWNHKGVEWAGKHLPLLVASALGVDPGHVKIRNDMDGVLPGVASVLAQANPAFWQLSEGNFAFAWKGSGYGFQFSVKGVPMNAPTEAGHMIFDFRRPGEKVFDTESYTSIPSMLHYARTMAKEEGLSWPEIEGDALKPMADAAFDEKENTKSEIARAALKRFADKFASNLAMLHMMSQRTGKGTVENVLLGGGVARGKTGKFLKFLTAAALQSYGMSDQIAITVIDEDDIRKAGVDPDTIGALGSAYFIQSVLAARNENRSEETQPFYLLQLDADVENERGAIPAGVGYMDLFHELGAHGFPLVDGSGNTLNWPEDIASKIIRKQQLLVYRPEILGPAVYPIIGYYLLVKEKKQSMGGFSQNVLDIESVEDPGQVRKYRADLAKDPGAHPDFRTYLSDDDYPVFMETRVDASTQEAFVSAILIGGLSAERGLMRFEVMTGEPGSPEAEPLQIKLESSKENTVVTAHFTDGKLAVRDADEVGQFLEQVSRDHAIFLRRTFLPLPSPRYETRDIERAENREEDLLKTLGMNKEQLLKEMESPEIHWSLSRFYSKYRKSLPPVGGVKGQNYYFRILKGLGIEAEYKSKILEIHENALGGFDETAAALGINHVSLAKLQKDLGLNLQTRIIPPGMILKKMTAATETPQAVKQRLLEELRLSNWNLVALRKKYAEKVPKLAHVNFSYGNVLWGWNLHEEFLAEYEKRRKEYGGIATHIGTSFGIERQSAKQDMERILKDLALLRGNLQAPEEEPAVAASGLEMLWMTKAEALELVQSEGINWDMTKLLKAVDVRSGGKADWWKHRGYTYVLRQLELTEDFKQVFVQRYADYHGFIGALAGSFGLNTHELKLLTKTLKINTEIYLQRGNLLRILSPESPAVLRARILSDLTQSKWSDFAGLKQKLFAAHPFISLEQLSQADLIWGLDIAAEFEAVLEQFKQENPESLNKTGMAFGWQKGAAKRTLISIVKDLTALKEWESMQPSVTSAQYKEAFPHIKRVIAEFVESHPQLAMARVLRKDGSVFSPLSLPQNRTGIYAVESEIRFNVSLPYAWQVTGDTLWIFSGAPGSATPKIPKPKEEKKKTRRSPYDERSENREDGWVSTFMGRDLTKELAKIDHPSIPKFRINSETQESEVLYVKGPRMSDWIQRHARGDKDAFEKQIMGWMLQIADALEVLHAQGIPHGDIKADNVVIDESNRAILVDFGDPYVSDVYMLHAFYDMAMIQRQAQIYPLKPGEFSIPILELGAAAQAESDPLWLNIEALLKDMLGFLPVSTLKSVIELYYTRRWASENQPKIPDADFVSALQGIILAGIQQGLLTLEQRLAQEGVEEEEGGSSPRSESRDEESRTEMAKRYLAWNVWQGSHPQKNPPFYGAETLLPNWNSLPREWENYHWDLASHILDDGAGAILVPELPVEMRADRLAWVLYEAKRGPHAIFELQAPEAMQRDREIAGLILEDVNRFFSDGLVNPNLAVNFVFDSTQLNRGVAPVQEMVQLNQRGIFYHHEQQHADKQRASGASSIKGGDWFRVSTTQNGRYALLEIADGMGHGPDAMQAEMFRDAVHFYELRKGTLLTQILKRFEGPERDRYIYDYLSVLGKTIQSRSKNPNGFYTYSLALVDYKNGTVQEWGGGHHLAALQVLGEEKSGWLPYQRGAEGTAPIGSFFPAPYWPTSRGAVYRKTGNSDTRVSQVVLYTDGAYQPATKGDLGIHDAALNRPAVQNLRGPQLLNALRELSVLKGTDDITILVADLRQGFEAYLQSGVPEAVKENHLTGIRSEMRPFGVESRAKGNADADVHPVWEDTSYSSYIDKYEAQWVWMREHVLPELIENAKRQNRRDLKILVPGASTGEELVRIFYEVTRYLQETGESFGTNSGQDWKIQVEGIELNPEVAAEGNSRILGEAAFQALPTDNRTPSDYAVGITAALNRFLPASRESLRLVQGDLRDAVKNPEAPSYDLIVFNSVLYFFESAEKRRILESYSSKWPQAWLAMTAVWDGDFTQNTLAHEVMKDKNPPSYLAFKPARSEMREVNLKNQPVLLLPGTQIASKPKVGEILYQNEPAFRKVFDRAAEFYRSENFDLIKHAFEDTPDQLNRLENSQPVQVAMTYALMELLKEKLGPEFKPGAFAGSSTNQITALMAAGSLSFEDGLRLALAQGKILQSLADKKEGDIGYVIGLTEPEIQALAAKHQVFVSIFGNTTFFNLSGPRKNIADAIAEAKAQEKVTAAKVLAEIGTPTHSQTMSAIEREMKQTVQALTIHAPETPVIGGSTGDYLWTEDQVRRELEEMLLKPVFWRQAMERLRADGAEVSVEIGTLNKRPYLIEHSNANQYFFSPLQASSVFQAELSRFEMATRHENREDGDEEEINEEPVLKMEDFRRAFGIAEGEKTSHPFSGFPRMEVYVAGDHDFQVLIYRDKDHKGSTFKNAIFIDVRSGIAGDEDPDFLPQIRVRLPEAPAKHPIHKVWPLVQQKLQELIQEAAGRGHTVPLLINPEDEENETDEALEEAARFHAEDMRDQFEGALKIAHHYLNHPPQMIIATGSSAVTTMAYHLLAVQRLQPALPENALPPFIWLFPETNEIIHKRVVSQVAQLRNMADLPGRVIPQDILNQAEALAEVQAREHREEYLNLIAEDILLLYPALSLAQAREWLEMLMSQRLAVIDDISRTGMKYYVFKGAFKGLGFKKVEFAYQIASGNFMSQNPSHVLVGKIIQDDEKVGRLLATAKTNRWIGSEGPEELLENFGIAPLMLERATSQIEIPADPTPESLLRHENRSKYIDSLKRLNPDYELKAKGEETSYTKPFRHPALYKGIINYKESHEGPLSVAILGPGLRLGNSVSYQTTEVAALLNDRQVDFTLVGNDPELLKLASQPQIYPREAFRSIQNATLREALKALTGSKNAAGDFVLDPAKMKNPIHVFAANFQEIQYGKEELDIVIATQSLLYAFNSLPAHERIPLLVRVLSTLKPGGELYMDNDVIPSLTNRDPDTTLSDTEERRAAWELKERLEESGMDVYVSIDENTLEISRPESRTLDKSHAENSLRSEARPEEKLPSVKSELKVASEVTARILSLSRIKGLFDLLFPKAYAAETYQSMTPAEKRRLTEVYTAFFESGGKAVLPAAAFAGLPDDVLADYFEPILEAAKNSESGIKSLIIAGSGHDFIKNYLFSKRFVGLYPSLSLAASRFIELTPLPEEAKAAQIKETGAAVSFLKAPSAETWQAASVPALMWDTEALSKSSSAEKLQTLHRMTQLQFLIADQLKNQPGDRVKLVGELLGKLGIQYTPGILGLPQPELSSLLSETVGRMLSAELSAKSA